jgi:hypothetical protein
MQRDPENERSTHTRKATDEARADGDARSVALAEAHAESDARVLAHWRSFFGYVEDRFDGRYDVPLIHGGFAALLTRADLSSDEGRRAFLGRCGDGASALALEDLRMLQDMSRAIDLVLSQHAPRVLDALRLAHGDVYSKTDKYVAVVGIVEDVKGMLERTARYYAQSQDARGHAHVFADTMFRLRRAFRALCSVDARFAALRARDVRELGADATAVNIATKLSLRTGALDVTSGNATSGREAYRNARRLFTKALEATPDEREKRAARSNKTERRRKHR